MKHYFYRFSMQSLCLQNLLPVLSDSLKNLGMCCVSHWFGFEWKACCLSNVFLPKQKVSLYYLTTVDSSAPRTLYRDQKCINQHSGIVSPPCSCSERVSEDVILVLPFLIPGGSHMFLPAWSMQQQLVCKSTSTAQTFCGEKTKARSFLAMKSKRTWPWEMFMFNILSQT